MIRRPPKADPKQRSLEESGTANPHARDVQDPAFIDSDFFDPRDLIQVRYEMLRCVQTEGQSVAKASAMFGVSRPTFYKARSDFDQSGLVGLLPAKRGPRQPHKITPEVARFIEETVRREELTAQRLVERIAERFGLVVHQRTVKRALARLKKSAVSPAAANLDGHALAARYEVLRNDVASADRRHTLHSLALLMRKGMAAWIKDVGQELPVREDITPPASSAMCVPEGIQRSLVDIVAAMAFATALEGAP